MVFHSRTISIPLSHNLRLHGLDVTVVHTLKEGLDLQNEFDLLLVDIDFPLMDDGKTRIPIFDEGERVEELFDRPYPVFNFLKKVTTRVLLHDTWSEVPVNSKLNRLGVAKLVSYVRGPLLVRDLLPMLERVLSKPLSV
jgi:CheY-like chemotaxis protein